MSNNCKNKETVYEYLKEYAHDKPKHLLMADEADSFDCVTVLKQVDGMAAGLIKIGIKPGSRVVLRMERNTTSAVMLLALMAIGAETMLVDESITVIDYFKYKEFENTQGYITHENNTGWVRVSFTESDINIISRDEKFDECTEKGSASVIFFNPAIAGEKIELNQKDIIEIIAGMTRYDGLDCRKSLCIASMAALVGCIGVIGSIIAGYQTIFPRLFGARHLLHCISCYDAELVIAGKDDYLSLIEFVNEYELERLKLGMIEDMQDDNKTYQYIEKALGIELLEIRKLCLDLFGEEKK